jgi:eukaryotic-like serine/threonine-protein kinase
VSNPAPVEAIFFAALEKGTPAERAAYLDQTCGTDMELRRRVERLLRAHPQAASFLEQPAVALAAAEGGLPTAGLTVTFGGLTASEQPGTEVGPYKLLQKLGEGGFGTVWMAEQQHPVQRRVALKLVKTGIDSGRVLARFEAERQALALMDHPNIAKVLDAGTTDGNRPYFVMELVKGVPITKYCDEQHLTPQQRLQLFVPVCQAVQHAHQKGIIHRDLKPSNVLVALYDGKPAAKVIDFGVAKATGPKLTDRTLFTELGQVVGTLEYMSPEQAELDQLDIDTRSDIYSLGVLLYELLTGTTPLNRKRLKETALLDVLRTIREEEPPKPSTRLSSTEELPSIAANRGLEPRKLSGLLRGELDWIVMKCLEKDRARRYETANGLAMDLQRYLHDEPVAAGPPGVGYRLRKFVQRNRGAMLAAGLLLLTFCAGVAGIIWKWLDADYLKGQAQQAAEAARQKTQDEQAAKQELQKTLYDQAIALAYHEWQNSNPRRAEQLVADCRPEYRGWEWHYLHRLCHSDLLTLPAHDAPLNRVAVSPDGRLLAAASGWWDKEKPGEVIVWDITTGRELATLQGHTRNVTSVAFHPDSRQLASAGLDPAVRLWDVTTGRQTAVYPGRGGGWIKCVRFSRDGGRLAASDGNLLRVWDVAAGIELLAVPCGADRLQAVDFSPDGRQIAGGCRFPSVVKIWDAQTGSELQTLQRHNAVLESVAFSPDGRRVASAAWDHKVKVWDIAARKELFTLPHHTGVVSRVVFSPDSRILASASFDGTIRLWDASSGTDLRTFRGHTGIVTGAAFSPDGERVVSVGTDRQLRTWDVMTEQECRTLHFPGAHAHGLAFSADGNLLAVADGSIYGDPRKTVGVWDRRTGLKLCSLEGHAGRVTSVAFNPIRPDLASGSADATIKLWDAVGGRLVSTLQGHTGDVTGVAFAHDGSRVASSSADRTVRIWDPATKQECRVLRGHTDTVTGVAFAPNGNCLASSSADRTVRIWDHATGQERFVLRGHTDAVNAVAFSPDGRQLASAGADQTLIVWDAATGEQLFVLRGHTEAVWSLAYSPRGDRLVSASRDDRTVRVWDAGTGRQLLSLWHEQVLSVAFSPDGECFASGASDDTIKIWDAAPPRLDDPWSAAAWFRYYAGKNQWDKAAAALGRLDQQLPSDANLWRAAGHVYREVSSWDRAADAFARALQYGGEEQAWVCHSNIALCRSRQGRWDEAVAHGTKAIQVGAPGVTPWRTRASSYVQLRQWERASADYTEAIRREPGDVALWRERARCFAEQAKWREAAADFAEASKRDPADRALRYYRAVALMGAKDADSYRQVCAEVLRPFDKPDKPSGPTWWVVNTCMLAPDAVSDFRLVLQLAEQQVEKYPTNWYAHTELGGIYYRAGRFEDAIRSQQAACKAHGNEGNAYNWLFLAMTHCRLGHMDEARRWLDRAVAWIEPATQGKVKDSRTPIPLRWDDRAHLQVLRSEADALIRGKPGDETTNTAEKK